jgi:hypothetical protein
MTPLNETPGAEYIAGEKYVFGWLLRQPGEEDATERPASLSAEELALMNQSPIPEPPIPPQTAEDSGQTP